MKRNLYSVGRRFSRFMFLLSISMIVGSIAVLIGCDSSQPTADGSKPIADQQPIVLMLNWYPEAEHGGFYAAQVHGVFEKYGLQVEIRPGGPNAPVAQELLTGRIHFGIGNADDVLLFRQAKANIVALFAPIQNTPRCIMVHASSAIQDLTQLAGITLQANRGQAFLDFMEHQGLLKQVTVVPYSGNLANFLADSKSATQAYSFSEPLLAKLNGVDTRSLMLSDIGFNPYASCLMATADYVQRNPDLVRRMVTACREGWQLYLNDPQTTNAQILKLNSQGMTAEALEFGAKSLEPLVLPEGFPSEELGKMSSERWQALADQFVQIGLATAENVQANKVFNNDFQQSAPDGK